jgi:hypothetical protein
VQGRYVTKEAQKGTSPGDMAFSLAKMAYRNGSLDDISVYVLPLDTEQRRDAEHGEGSILGNSGTQPEPLLAPETPAQRNSSEAPTLSPLGAASVGAASTGDSTFEAEGTTKPQPLPAKDGR